VSLFSSKSKPPEKPAKVIAERPAKVEPPAIHVAEVGQALPPWAEEAAMLYATGNVDGAVDCLARRIDGNAEARDMLPWLMLFDIHEMRQQRVLFEQLGLDFAVKFERSPPPWAPPAPLSADAAPERKVVKIEFGASFGPVDKARLEHSLLEATECDAVLLDLSHTPAPLPNYARLMLDCVRRLRALRKPIDIDGGAAFVVRMNAACANDRLDQNGWLLLLAIEELLDDPNGYEEFALAYAVRFEISPPSFTPPIKPPPEPDAPMTPSQAPDTFYFEGAIDSKHTPQLKAFVEFARPRGRVVADLARLTRIDFTASGLVLDTLIRLAEAKRQTVLKDCNTLVMAMLQMLGADQYAILLPRKRV
jgi:anti-anti-sigma regulatory factor